MNKGVSKKDLRAFGLIVGFFLPLFIGWIIPSLFNHSFRLWTLYIAIPFLLFAIFAPKKLSNIYHKWINLGNFLSNINNYFFLLIIFFLIVLPMSLLMKLFKYDPLRIRNNRVASYREFTKDDKINYEKIF